ncbi:hypothetical protein VPH35_078910 [Triticum aestivum]|uniref:Uncharacterized protein n=2 Tax=Aegilops tauschii subsp. strangulata TaxID=200361 RepID=A0A453IKP4_AEGTS
MMLFDEIEHAEEHVLNFKVSTLGDSVESASEPEHVDLYEDYFVPDALFDHYFHRRYWMHRPLFLRIMEDVRAYDDYFELKKDSVGYIGFSDLQKCTTATRMVGMEQSQTTGMSTFRFLRAHPRSHGQIC